MTENNYSWYNNYTQQYNPFAATPTHGTYGQQASFFSENHGSPHPVWRPQFYPGADNSRSPLRWSGLGQPKMISTSSRTSRVPQQLPGTTTMTSTNEIQQFDAGKGREKSEAHREGYEVKERGLGSKSGVLNRRDVGGYYKNYHGISRSQISNVYGYFWETTY